jgi:hypothetical protein
MPATEGALALAASGLVTYLVHSTLVLTSVWAGLALARAGARTRDVAWKCALCLPLATATVHVVWPERVLARRYTVEVPMLAQVGLDRPARPAVDSPDTMANALLRRTSVDTRVARRPSTEAPTDDASPTSRRSVEPLRCRQKLGSALLA